MCDILGHLPKAKKNKQKKQKKNKQNWNKVLKRLGYLPMFHFNFIDGALLGDILLSTVTIAKSDYPNGRFGFKGQLQVKMDNPANQVQRMFSIERTGGLLGQQTVS